MSRPKRPLTLIEAMNKGTAEGQSGKTALPGWWKSGDQKSGDQKSGDQKSGEQKSGDQKSGDQKSGELGKVSPQSSPEASATGVSKPSEKPTASTASTASSASSASTASSASSVSGMNRGLRRDVGIKSARGSALGDPVFSVKGSQVVLSLSSVSAGLVAFCVCMIVGIAFLGGQRMGRTAGEKSGFEKGVAYLNADAGDAIMAARNSQPDTHIFDGVGDSPVRTQDQNALSLASPDDYPVAVSGSSASGSGSSGVSFVNGHTYIVVQEFRSEDGEDATDAQRFLADRGIETTILDSKGTYKYRLITVKGFNREDPDQKRWSDEFLERIQEVGDAYKKAGGRYSLQGYQKTYTGPTRTNTQG